MNIGPFLSAGIGAKNAIDRRRLMQGQRYGFKAE
jgi:hypothetical protein